MAVTVLVTGATGYIAQHVVQQLIAKGYHVIGTVRSTEKGEALKKNFPAGFSYAIVKDIQAEGAFDEVFKNHKEITVVLHTASPFTFNIEDPEKDLLIPAVNGTKNVLKSTKEFAPQVTKFVVTSSYAAIGDFTKDNDPSVTFSEKDWNPLTWEQAKANSFDGYIASKQFAERAAWDFVKENKPNFTLTTVNPTYVFGPQAFDSEVKGTLGTSSEIVNAILKLKPGEKVQENAGPWIDVRDVARAHLVAFENEKASGHRLALSQSRFYLQELIDLVLKNFPQLKGKISSGDPEAKSPGFAKLDFSETEEILGFKYIGLEQSVIDSVKQILDNQ